MKISKRPSRLACDGLIDSSQNDGVMKSILLSTLNNREAGKDLWNLSWLNPIKSR